MNTQEKFPYRETEAVKNTVPVNVTGSSFPDHEIAAFHPRKIWLMKCNLKQQNTQPQSLKLLVVADDYGTAKLIADEYATRNTNSRTYVSNITGNEISHDYMLMLEPKTSENQP